MNKICRRALLHTGGLAASALTLLAAAHADGTGKEDPMGSVFHVFAFQWKPGTTEDQKEKAAREIVALQGQIPGLLQTHVGPNYSPRGKGYTFVGVMQFKDKASLDAYPQHPAHQALLVWLVPLIDAIELDLIAN
jgi:hypothetical protein